MKSKRFSRLPNILIKVLTIIILASLCGAKYLGLLSGIVNAEEGDFNFRFLFDNNPIFNMVNIDATMEGAFNVILEVQQSGTQVTLDVSRDITYANETFLCYDYMYSDDGSTWHTLDILPVSTYTTTYVPGRKYQVQVRTTAINYYTLIEDAYRNLLNRGVDASGLSTWGTRLTDHSVTQQFATLTHVTPTNEIASITYALLVSIEYLNGKTWTKDEQRELVGRLYEFALGRSASDSEKNSWSSRFDNDTSTREIQIANYLFDVPNALFTVINGICGSQEAKTWHSGRYYYDASTGKYTYATATLNNTTNYYKDSPVVRPSTLSVNPNGGHLTVTSPSSISPQTIYSTTDYKQFASISTSQKSQLTLGTPTKDDTSANTYYTVTYKYHDGITADTTDTATRTIETEYPFSNWTKSNPFNGTLATNNQTYTFPDNNGLTSTLTANYTASTKSDVTTPVTLPTPTRAGYTFTGWYTAATGGTHIKDGGEPYTPTANITLHAQWIKNTATVTIKMNNEDLSNSGIHVELYQGSTKKYAYDANNVTVSGATVSWDGVATGTYDIWASKEWGETMSIVDTGLDLVVNGNSSAIVNYYTVTLYRGTGISDVWRMDAYLPGVSVTIDAVVKPGYTWLHWTDCSCGENNCFCNPCNCQMISEDKEYTFTMPTEQLVRTAEATLNTYTINYDLDGGSVSGTNPTSYTVESNSITLINPTKQGYTFTGWTGTGLSGNTMTVTIPQGSIGDRSYVAHWVDSRAILTIRLDGADIRNSGAIVELRQGEDVKYPYSNAITQGQYIGWENVAEGTYDIYASKSHLEYTTVADTGRDIVMYSQNTNIIDYYTVTLYRGTGIESVTGGDVYLDSQNVTIDATVKPGYTWRGWTNCDCGENNCFCNPCQCELITTEKQYTFQLSGERVTRTAEATLNTYTIDYDLDGGTVSGTNPTSYTVEDDAITLINPTKPGYTFTGWTGTGLSGNTMSVTIPAGSIGNRSYVAHWTANAVVITIKKDNSNWNANSGIKVELRQSGTTKYSGTASRDTISLNGVTAGTYDIYASKSASSLYTLVDTGLDVVVTSSGTATIDYYTLTLQAGVGISAVSGGGTYLKNQTASIDATVANGYTWQGWSVISGNSPN